MPVGPGLTETLSLGSHAQPLCVREHQSRAHGIPHQPCDIMNIETFHHL
jgi:hypothetical protein